MLVAALDKPQPQSIGLQARGREVSLGSSVGLGEVEGVFGRDGAGVPVRPTPIAHGARGHCRLPSPSTAGSYLTPVDQSLSQMTAKWRASKQGAWSGHARHVQRLQHRHISCCGDRNAAGLAVVRAASAVGLAQTGSTALPVNVPAQPTQPTHSQPRVTQQHTSSSSGPRRPHSRYYYSYLR